MKLILLLIATLLFQGCFLTSSLHRKTVEKDFIHSAAIGDDQKNANEDLGIIVFVSNRYYYITEVDREFLQFFQDVRTHRFPKTYSLDIQLNATEAYKEYLSKKKGTRKPGPRLRLTPRNKFNWDFEIAAVIAVKDDLTPLDQARLDSLLEEIRELGFKQSRGYRNSYVLSKEFDFSGRRVKNNKKITVASKLKHPFNIRYQEMDGLIKKSLKILVTPVTVAVDSVVIPFAAGALVIALANWTMP